MNILTNFSHNFKKITNKWTQGLSSLFMDNSITEEFWNELEELLILGDVGIDLTDSLIIELKKATNNQKIINTSQLRSSFSQILIDLLNSVPNVGEAIKFSTKPYFLILIGVNGSGKTTTVGKLASHYKKNGHNVLMVAADTYRAAAIEQIKAWGEKTSVRVIAQKPNSDPAAVVYDAINSSKSTDTDVVLIDTAGRLHTKSNLMEELEKIHRIIKREMPQSDIGVLLVLDSVTGQNAFLQAEAFNKIIPISGVILTKYDNTSKGGIILSIVDKLKLPIRYVGLGEEVEDLQVFDKKSFIKDLLGEGMH